VWEKHPSGWLPIGRCILMIQPRVIFSVSELSRMEWRRINGLRTHNVAVLPYVFLILYPQEPTLLSSQQFWDVVPNPIL
jgi:hypothetical protein